MTVAAAAAVDGEPGSAGVCLTAVPCVRQRRIGRRLVEGGGQALHRAVQLVLVHDDDRVGGPAPASTLMILRGSKLRPPPAASTLCA